MCQGASQREGTLSWLTSIPPEKYHLTQPPWSLSRSSIAYNVVFLCSTHGPRMGRNERLAAEMDQLTCTDTTIFTAYDVTGSCITSLRTLPGEAIDPQYIIVSGIIAVAPQVICTKLFLHASIQLLILFSLLQLTYWKCLTRKRRTCMLHYFQHMHYTKCC